MEPGDLDTEFPRVKPGRYDLEPHGWEKDARVKFQRVWALVGNGVTHWAEPGSERSTVLVHWGNFDGSTRGCVLVGKGKGVLNGEPALLRSREAIDFLRNRFGRSKLSLTIME